VPKRILVLAAEPVSGEALKSAVGGEAAEADVLVVAPALTSRTRFWASDSDEAIGRAEEVQQETVEQLDREGIDAAGDTGESDPLLALQDALQTFEADEIVICTHPGADQNWAEDGLVEEAQQRFSQPVKHLEVT
jgi:GABA permease